MSSIDPTKRRLTRLTCAPHTAPYLAREIRDLGFEIQHEDATGVEIGATLGDCMALNLRLRTAHHVLWLLTRFRCPSPKALYTNAAAFAWEELIPTDGYLSVTSSVDHPKITNSMHANLVLKDAVVDRIAKRAGARPDSGPDRSMLVLHLHWSGDRALVYLDTSGQTLADRGYRRIPHAAPMRETLAASVLMAGGYDGSAPLVNPMCGAGTLAIEGALIATGRAPGLLRSNFGLLHTALDLDEPWRAARREAKAAQNATPPPIIATDHDQTAIDAAKQNARVAGVDHLIDFHICDFADTPMPEGPGHVVMNPEYGERMGNAAELGETYKRIGDFLKQRCAGWTGHVFTGSRELSKKIGLRPSSRTPFMNAQIKCRLLSYELYAGTSDS